MKYDGMYGFLLLAFSSFVAFVCGWLLNSTVLLHFCCCCYSIRVFCDECMCVYVCQCRRMEFALTDQPTDRPTNCPTLFLTVLSNVYMYVWVFMCVGVCNCHFTCWLRYSFHTERQSINISLFSVIHTADQRGWGEVRETDCLSQTICVFILQTRQKKDEIQ